MIKLSPRRLNLGFQDAVDNIRDELEASSNYKGSGLEGSISTYESPKLIRLENQILYEHVDNPAGLLLGNDKFYRDKKGSPAPVTTLFAVSEASEGDVDLRDKESLQFSARLDVSSMTDIKTPTLLGDFNARSAIEASADVLNLKGTEFVQIKAGGRRYNSRGARVDSRAEIHLFTEGAGEVQSLPMGDSLVSVLEDIIERVSELTATVQKLHSESLTFKTTLAAHTHIAPLIGPTTPSIELMTATIAGAVNDATSVANIIGNVANNMFVPQKYLKPYSPKNILSKNVKIN
jgi:hypothetical protein